MIDKIVSFLAIIIDKWYFIILLILFCIYPLTIYFFEWLFYRQTSTKRTTNENSGLFYFKPKKAVKWFDFSLEFDTILI